MTKKAQLPNAAALSAYFSALGSIAGKAGTGKAKKRGSKAFYRELQLKAAAARKANNVKREKAGEGKK